MDSLPKAAAVPAEHAVHLYSLFERVWSTPQLPVRIEPGVHTRLSQSALGQASLICCGAPGVKYWLSSLLHGVQLPCELPPQPARYWPTGHLVKSAQGRHAALPGSC